MSWLARIDWAFIAGTIAMCMGFGSVYLWLDEDPDTTPGYADGSSLSQYFRTIRRFFRETIVGGFREMPLLVIVNIILLPFFAVLGAGLLPLLCCGCPPHASQARKDVCNVCRGIFIVLVCILFYKGMKSESESDDSSLNKPPQAWTHFVC